MYNEEQKKRAAHLYTIHFGNKRRVCKDLGIDRKTLNKWLEQEEFKALLDSIEYPDDIYKEAWLEARRRITGYQIKERHETTDPENQKTVKIIKKQIIATDGLLEFVLERKGKAQGWAQRQEVTGADGKDLGVKIDLSNASIEELERIIKLAEQGDTA